MEELQILVIDDEPKMAKLMASALKSEGRIIETETKPKAALKRVERERFDIVITDLKMPDVDGIQILSAARHHAPPSA
ncbi:TPA: two-component system response regulator, partial [bacterium]|nr:two-component system response regulator [bacterium]